MHGTYTANMALYECDLLINIGARFDDRLNRKLRLILLQMQRLSHISILIQLKSEKMYRLKFRLLRDAKEALEALLNLRKGKYNHNDWLSIIE